MTHAVVVVTVTGAEIVVADASNEAAQAFVAHSVVPKFAALLIPAHASVGLASVAVEQIPTTVTVATAVPALAVGRV